MKRKTIKKALTAIMAATLIFTSSGFETIASAAEVKVQAVYTTFVKAAMTVGETKQIKTYTEPENASNKEMEFSSSNESVATVSDTGLVTAVAPGTANIKVKATDGSGEYETVKVTVVKSVTIDKKSVDSDNDVILLDKSYADLTIKKSVGNANIYLSKVNVKGKLTLEDGDYKVYIYDSSLNNVIVDKAQTSGKIASMALDTNGLGSPTICMSDNTRANDIMLLINSVMQMANGATANRLDIMQKYNDVLSTYINGFNGSMNVSAASGQVDVKLIDSTLGSATVSGGTGSTVNFGTDDKSKVGQLTATKQVKLALAVPTDNLLVDSSATGSLTVSSPVGTLTNNGSGSTLTIDSTVNSLLSTGANAKITIGSKGTVAAATLSGAGSSVAGSGLLKALDIKANNCIVNTVGTAVKLGNVTGTMVQGQPMSAGETATTISLPVGGGTGTSTTTPTKVPTVTVAPTTVAPTTGAATATPLPSPVTLDLSTVTSILDPNVATSTDATYDTTTGEITAENVNILKVNLPDKVLKDETRYIQVKGNYTGSTGFRSWFSDNSQGTLAAIVNIANGQANAIPCDSGNFTINYALTANADATTLLFKGPSYGKLIIGLKITSIKVYTYDPLAVPTATPTPEATPTPADKLMFSADFEDGVNPFTVASWDNPTTNTQEHNMGIKGVESTGYNSNKSLLIDVSSLEYRNVRGIGYHFVPTASTTYRITARVKNANTDAGKKVHFVKVPGYSTVVSADVNNSDWTLIDMTITLDVATDVWLAPISDTDGAFSYYVDDFKVYEKAAETTAPTPTTEADPTPSPEADPTTAPTSKPLSSPITFDDVAVGTTFRMLGTGTASVAQVSGNNNALDIKPGGYGSAPVIQVNLPAGKKLRDYSSLQFNVFMKAGDIGWKDIALMASANLTGAFSNSTNILGKFYRASGASTAFEPITITFDPTVLSGSTGDLSGTFDLALGINCSGSKDTVATNYLFDNITLVETPTTVPATGPAIYTANLSKVSGVSYSSSDGSMTVTNAQAYVYFKDAVTATGSAIVVSGSALTTTVTTGSAITLTVTGKYTGTGGFRFYLTNAAGSGQSGIIGVNLASDNTATTLSRFTTDASGNFNITITLTATNGDAIGVLFKGPSGSAQNVDSLTINTIKFVCP